MRRKLIAEFIGTFWLTFGGCGSVVLWGGKAEMTSVSLAFGLTVVTMAYAVGHISGAHLNPAVSVGLAAGGRFPWKDVGPYAAAQIAGGVLAALLLFVLTKDLHGTASLGANAYGEHMTAGLIGELVLTTMFLIVILGVTAKKGNELAGLVIGLCLALIHMIGIPLTGVSVNPARSIGPALFQGGVALEQLWLFVIVPPIGALLAAGIYKQMDPGAER
jgi:aquaporin Z